MFKITEQQKLFIDEYLRLRKSNQAQAAINAGYSKRSAASQASQLLNKPNIMEYLDYRESQIESELRKEFMFDALEARKVMYSILKDSEARNADKINIAKDFLDRAGFKPVDKTEVDLSVDKSLEDFFESDV